MAAGAVTVAALAAAVTAARRPRIRGSLERLAAWTLRHWSRMLRRPAEDPGRTVQAWADRLGSLRLPASVWMAVTGLALANWLADAAVFAVSIRAAGAAVCWHILLLAYGSGVAAQNLNERGPVMREPLGQAASRTSGGAGVRAGGMAADAMDRPCPAGPDRLAARPPAAPR